VKRYRVIQWYTGAIACEQIRMMARDRARYETVGAVSRSGEKAGRDAGEIAGIGAVGAPTTIDEAEALAWDADCVLLNSRGVFEAELIARILVSGKNVICITGGYDLVGQPEHVALEAAARAGGVTFTATGNMPGLLNDAIPMFLSGFSREIERIWCRERSIHWNYESADSLRRLGYGLTPEEHAMAGSVGDAIVKRYLWLMRQGAAMVAHAMGHELSDYQLTRYETVAAQERLDLPGSGLQIPEGRVAGMRFEFTGFVAGRPWHILDVEHVATVGLGPNWRQTMEEEEFEVQIDGATPLRLKLNAGRDGHLVHVNAARAVNLVPATCKAAPGCARLFELPHVVGTLPVWAGAPATRTF
jgi:4-hydroxy-tetrahydrodipicolinate reductase